MRNVVFVSILRKRRSEYMINNSQNNCLGTYLVAISHPWECKIYLQYLSIRINKLDKYLGTKESRGSNECNRLTITIDHDDTCTRDIIHALFLISRPSFSHSLFPCSLPFPSLLLCLSLLLTVMLMSLRRRERREKQEQKVT
jgi:hypothetical protein